MSTSTAAAHAPGPGDVLALLRHGGSHTRAELVERSGLSRSTIAARVDTLLTLGLIEPAGEAHSSGGRPPARIAFAPGSRRVLAIDLGATTGTVALTNLRGDILDTVSLDIPIADGPAAVLDRVIALGQSLLERDPEGAPLLGIGLGVPGPVEHDTGRPISPPIMPGWDRYDIPGHVRRVLDAPVYVDNDVNLLARGERTLTRPDAQDLLFVKVSTGIGAGIFAGGALQRGAQGSAGDLGHVRVPRHRDSPRPLDDERELEDIASGTAIARELRAHGRDAPDTAAVVSLLRDGDRLAGELTRQAGREIGEALSAVVNILNPEAIILGGSLSRAGEHLLAGVREIVYGRSIPLATQQLSIVVSTAPDTAGAIGAALMVIDDELSPLAVNRLAARTA